MILLEIICCSLLIALFYVVNKALSQFNASKDLIMKWHAFMLALHLISKYSWLIFLSCGFESWWRTYLSLFIIVKALNTLVYILHYQGSLLQGYFTIDCISFFNDLSIVFFYIACSLMVFKWVVIIKRVYLFAGFFSESTYRYHINFDTVVYTCVVLIGSLVNIGFMGMELK